MGAFSRMRFDILALRDRNLGAPATERDPLHICFPVNATVSRQIAIIASGRLSNRPKFALTCLKLMSGVRTRITPNA